MRDPRVEAVRKDELVGEGSCTTVDEALEDKELLELLDESGVTTPAAAIEWARDFEGLQKEQATNFRWGEDEDPEIKILHDWDNARDAADEKQRAEERRSDLFENGGEYYEYRDYQERGDP